MFSRTKICISRQLYASFCPLRYFLLMLGILPITVEKDKLSVNLKWSPFYTLYSYTLGLILIGNLIYGEISDVVLSGKVTVDIVTNTDKLATWFVLSGYCVATFIGIFIMGSRFLQLFDVFECINQVDSIMKPNLKKYGKKLNTLMPTLLFGSSVVGYFAAAYTYYVAIGNAAGLVKMFIKRYNFLTINVYVGLSVECMLRYLVHCIENRFARLHEELLAEYQNIKKGSGTISKNVLSTKIFKHGNNLTRGENLISLVSTYRCKATRITQLSQAYLKLIQAIQILNDLFGPSLVVVTVSVFFGIVRTSYYIILLLQGKHNGTAELVMRLSILSHQCMRTLFITEPLYWCMIRVDSFLLSICLLEEKFSACGLFDIDRNLIVNLIGSIITYVVILLQAQEQDEQ